MEERYQIRRIEAELSVNQFMEDYYNWEYTESLCRKCKNYGALWSCPPYNFSTEEYLRGFDTLQLIGTQILLDPQLRAEVITKESIAEVTEEIIAAVKAETDKELLAREKEHPGCRMLSSGGCRICTRCARIAGMPCRQKGKMRYSLEALGCDVMKIARDKLGIELLWVKDRLPEYFVLVNGFLQPTSAE